MITREELVRLARTAVTGVHRPGDCENPASYDPPEWAIEAMAAAWKAGGIERAREFTDLVMLVAAIESIPFLEVTDDEIHVHNFQRSGMMITGAMFVQTMRDWMARR